MQPIDAIMLLEDGTDDPDEYRRAWDVILETGVWRQLQGSWQRAALEEIERRRHE